MLDRIREFIQTKCLLDHNKHILAGFSGGPDSLTLVHALRQLGFPVVAAHFNHHLRPEANEEVASVSRLAEQLKIPLITGEGSVKKARREFGLSVEEAARMLRYRFLFEKAQEIQAQAVVVGHTADDQVETVLMHLIRGSGISGLKGMVPRKIFPLWSQTTPLVRPLLPFWRAETLEYCTVQGLGPLEDQSNLDLTFFRNRLRHELIPFLKTFNPRVARRIYCTAEILAGDEQVLEQIAGETWATCILRRGANFLFISRQEFNSHPAALQRRLLRMALAELKPGFRDLSFQGVERARLAILSADRCFDVSFVQGLHVYGEKDRFIIAPGRDAVPGGEHPQVPAGPPLTVPEPGVIRLPEGWLLTIERLEPTREVRVQALKNPDSFQAWLDADRVGFPVELRGRKEGELFQPLGMDGHTLKISDFMVNVKVPQHLRKRWPLLVSAGQIVWVPGYRIGHHCRITGSTRAVFHCKLSRKS